MVDSEVFVIDGQNPSEILYHQQFNTLWDPCIPVWFYPDRAISITFNSTNIQKLEDWYPIQICSQLSSVTYGNDYFFDGGKSMKINNLIIILYIQ